MLSNSLILKLGIGLVATLLLVGCMEKNPYHVPAPDDGIYTLVLVLDGDYSNDDALKKIRPSGQYSPHIPAQDVKYDAEKKVTIARFNRLPDAQPIYYQRRTITEAAKEAKELFPEGKVLELFLINAAGSVMSADLEKPAAEEE